MYFHSYIPSESQTSPFIHFSYWLLIHNTVVGVLYEAGTYISPAPGSPPAYGGVSMLIFLIFGAEFFCFVCVRPVTCVPTCCQCICIVSDWFPLRDSLAFKNPKLAPINQYCTLFSKIITLIMI